MYLAHSFGLKIVGHYVCVRAKRMQLRNLDIGIEQLF